MLELQPANKPLFIIYELANCSSLTWNKGLPHFEIEKDLSDCKIAIVLCDHPSEVICRLPQMPVRIRVKLHQNNIHPNYPVDTHYWNTACAPGECDALSLVTVGWNLYILSSVILTLQSQDQVWPRFQSEPGECSSAGQGSVSHCPRQRYIHPKTWNMTHSTELSHQSPVITAQLMIASEVALETPGH